MYKFFNNGVPENRDATIGGYDYITKNIGDKLYTINISRPHEEDNPKMMNLWTSCGFGFLLVFAINDKTSFDLIKSTRESILKEKHGKECPIILVGNKQDLAHNREVSYDEAKQLADSWNIEYIETSVNTNFNCIEPFDHLAEKIYESRLLKKNKSTCPCSIY